MSFKFNKLYYIDGQTAKTETVEGVIRRLSQPNLPSTESRGNKEAFEKLVWGFVCGKPVELLKSGGSNQEGRYRGTTGLLDLESLKQAERWHSLWQRSEEDGFSVALITSGTSGKPKQVVHTLGSMRRNLRISPRYDDDVWALTYPLHHIAGVLVWAQAMANFNPIIDVAGLGPRETLCTLRKYQVTHISATPTYYRLLLTQGEVVETINSVTVGGEVLDDKLHTNLQKLFPKARLHNVYASTEAGMILQAEGELFGVPPNLSHKVQVRKNRVYVHSSQLGHLSGKVETDEWYDTGDEVEVVSSEPLRFRFLGRSRRVVNVGGEKVIPQEVERVLLEHPAVADAVVTGHNNSVTGELLQAEVIAKKPEPSEAELRSFMSRRLPPFKVPRIITFVSKLSTTHSGKAIRR